MSMDSQNKGGNDPDSTAQLFLHCRPHVAHLVGHAAAAPLQGSLDAVPAEQFHGVGHPEVALLLRRFVAALAGQLHLAMSPCIDQFCLPPRRL